MWSRWYLFSGFSQRHEEMVRLYPIPKPVSRVWRPAFIAVCLVLVTAILTVSLALGATDCTGRTNCCDGLSADSNTCPRAEFGDSLAVALVVGSDAYTRNFGSDLGDLVNARNDAGTVGDALATQGFTVRYLFDPNRGQVEAELAGFLAYMKRRETTVSSERAHAVVYFAGHGLSYTDDSGPLDYLVFGPDPSGVQDTEFLFQNSRISTTAIERYFQTLRKFRIVYLFDACRTLTALQSTANKKEQFRGVRARAFSPRNFKSHLAQYAVVYTTESDTPAGDGTPSTGNGRYVSYLKRLLGLVGLEPSSIFHATNFLVASDQVPQFPPPIQSRGSFLRHPWNQTTSTTNSCLEFEKNLARAYSADCHEGLNDRTCKAEICNAYDLFKQSEISQCPRGRLFSLLFEEQGRSIESYCTTKNVAWNTSKALHDLTVNMGVPPPSSSSPESAILGNTLMKLSTVSNPSPFQITGGPLDQEGLARMRLNILPDTINRNEGILLPPTQRFWLRQLPREGDAPIYSHLPDGAWASLDCINVPCGNGFWEFP